RRDALLLRRARDVGRRLDAQAGDASRDEVLQLIAVVAGELDQQAARIEAEPPRRERHEVLRVLEPRARKRAEIGVLAEDLLGSDILLELHQEALAAHPGVQR